MSFDPRRKRNIPGGAFGADLNRMPSKGAPAEVAGSQPTGNMPRGGRRVALPPFNYPPRGSFFVNELGDADIAPAATAVLVRYSVTQATQLRLFAIGLGADDETALRFATWTLRVIPVENADPTSVGDVYQGLINVAASIGSLDEPGAVVVHVGGPATVTLSVTMGASVVTYRVLARITGYLYGEEAVDDGAAA